MYTRGWRLVVFSKRPPTLFSSFNRFSYQTDIWTEWIVRSVSQRNPRAQTKPTASNVARTAGTSYKSCRIRRVPIWFGGKDNLLPDIVVKTVLEGYFFCFLLLKFKRIGYLVHSEHTAILEWPFNYNINTFSRRTNVIFIIMGFTP